MNVLDKDPPTIGYYWRLKPKGKQIIENVFDLFQALNVYLFNLFRYL